MNKNVKSGLKRFKKYKSKGLEFLGAFNLGKVFNDTINFVNGLSFVSIIVGIASILAGVIGIGNILLIDC